MYKITKFDECALGSFIPMCVNSQTHTRCKCKMQILLLPLGGHAHWKSQDAYVLSRHCEPCKQSSQSQSRNSQENRPFLTASGVGTQSPTWTIAVS